MIEGKVTEGREIVVQLTVIGPTGKKAQIQTILDTGFTDHLSLPKAHIVNLELDYAESTIGLLADGKEVPVDSYAGFASWEEKVRPITIHCLEGTPLLGMALLLDHLLTIPVRPGATAKIEAME